MGIHLRIVDAPHTRFTDTRVGDMWRIPARDSQGREAWMVRLPNNTFWCTTDVALNKKTQKREMWEVSGTPPYITVTPSIDAMDAWHGHITEGVMETADG